MSAIKMQLIGDRELAKAFADIPRQFRRGILKKAVKTAVRPMVPSLRSATPKRKGTRLLGKNKNPPGTMRKSTGTVDRTYKSGDIQAVYVGHRWPKGAAAHLVAQGTQQRTTKSGKSTGRIIGNDFMRRVWKSWKFAIEQRLKLQLTLGLKQAVAKAKAHG